MDPRQREKRRRLALKLRAFVEERARRRAAAAPTGSVHAQLAPLPEESPDEPAPGPSPPPDREPKGGILPRPLRSRVLFGLLLVVLGGALVSSSPAPAPSPEPATTRATPAGPRRSVAVVRTPAPSPDRLVVLVLGVDSRQDRGRSDTILVGHTMLDRGRAHILSVPRDSFARIERGGQVLLDKVNHAYMWGGLELAKKTVEGLLGIHIDHTAVVDYGLFRTVVDAMGGVVIDVEKRMYYVDRAGGLKVDLHPGQQVLSGEQALQYVRFRHDAAGDYGRIQRQQRFLKAALTRLKDPRVLAYVAYKLPSILSFVNTDVSPRQALNLLWRVREFEPRKIMVTTVPGTGGRLESSLHRQKLFYHVVDQEKLSRLLKVWFFNPDATELPATSVGVGSSVRTATGTAEAPGPTAGPDHGTVPAAERLAAGRTEPAAGPTPAGKRRSRRAAAGGSGRVVASGRGSFAAATTTRSPPGRGAWAKVAPAHPRTSMPRGHGGGSHPSPDAGASPASPRRTRKAAGRPEAGWRLKTGDRRSGQPTPSLQTPDSGLQTPTGRPDTGIPVVAGRAGAGVPAMTRRVGAGVPAMTRRVGEEVPATAGGAHAGVSAVATPAAAPAGRVWAAGDPGEDTASTPEDEWPYGDASPPSGSPAPGPGVSPGGPAVGAPGLGGSPAASASVGPPSVEPEPVEDEVLVGPAEVEPATALPPEIEAEEEPIDSPAPAPSGLPAGGSAAWSPPGRP